MRQSFLGCPIDVLTKAETIALATKAMSGRVPTHHVAINVAKLVNMRRDPALAADVTGGDIIGIDGMGIVVGARLLGIPVKERVTGVDLFLDLLSICRDRGFRPFFLGGTEEVVKRAAAEAERRYPGIRFAGTRNGYFARSEEPEIVEQIRNSAADCLFIGMPTPRKERFLAAYKKDLDIPFIMGVGGSFDILSGLVQRAPNWMQASGLEWLYRIYQEPRRMWWRYARTNTLFAGILVRALLQRRLGHQQALSER